MKKILFVIFAIIIVIGVIACFCPAEVIVDGNQPVPVKNIFTAKNIVFGIKSHNKNKVLKSDIKYKFSPKACPLDDKQCEILLLDDIKYMVPCTVVLADNEAVAGLPSKDEAGLFLLKIKDRYRLPGGEEPEIKENITIDSSAIEPDLYFDNADKAAEYIFDEKARTRQEPKMYTVKKGDTLSGIAQNAGTTVGELKKLNPGMKPLRPGQKITVSAKVTDRAKITVVTRKEQHGVVSVPPSTVRVSTKKLPFGKSKVISPGKSGKKKVEGYAVYENGVKVREENTFEEYIVRPQPKQVATGI